MAVCRRLLPLLVLPLVLAACRDNRVESYAVPKEPDPAFPAAAGGMAGGAAPDGSGGSMAGSTVPVASGPGLTWTAPADWSAKTPSAMQKALYAVSGGGAAAELSVTAFPGDVGGELANVNRWRGQVGLPPVSEADLSGAVAGFKNAGLDFTVVDCAGAAGAQPQHIIGAIVPWGDGTWFFKLAGPDPLVARTKPAFLAFLRSVKASAQP